MTCVAITPQLKHAKFAKPSIDEGLKRSAKGSQFKLSAWSKGSLRRQTLQESKIFGDTQQVFLMEGSSSLPIDKKQHMNQDVAQHVSSNTPMEIARTEPVGTLAGRDRLHDQDFSLYGTHQTPR
ncbi:hypothetical protein VNO78_33565 [Psophocarpus tetragonolobus]|uniref:Uncharacterized protein n=1 Tax=Psophocarpus tetragonolobus TaxID=3891 RepID=A0AAN9NXG8_PSOTE